MRRFDMPTGSHSDRRGKEMVAIENLLDRTKFRETIDGEATDLYFLKNGKGMQVAITNYGGRIVSLIVEGREHRSTDVVIGFESLQQYLKSSEPYFGAIVGRYANRIANGKFELHGVEYNLFCNNPPNTLHGGKKGFQDVVWRTRHIGKNSLELTYLSKHLEEGYPGNLDLKVIYHLSEENELTITYYGCTDRTTIVNLTNHAFFNLNGAGSGTINNHQLQIHADAYLPINSSFIPNGNIESVAGTPFDFRKLTSIEQGLASGHPQLKNGRGFDHTFVVNGFDGKQIRHAATAIGDKTGIVLEVCTCEPGIQFYGGNFMQSKNSIRGGGPDAYRTAFCLETQHFPDSPNHPSFPSTVLMPGEIYQTETLYRFLLK